MYKKVIECYTQKYFQLDKRANRKEYISFILFYGIINLVLNKLFSTTQHEFLRIVPTLFSIISFIPSVTLAVRRLHDINLSGYFNLLIVPIILLIGSEQYMIIGIFAGLLYGCILIFMPGISKPNRYGEVPKDL